MAISCVLGGRELLKINPIWSPHLEHITTMEYIQVKDCYEFLMKQYSSSEDSTNSNGKILEQNKNISNQPKVLSMFAERSCTERGKLKGGIKARMFSIKPHRGNENKEQSKFNIKAKREEIENLKKAIKNRLISLNNKSRTIERLLNDNNPQIHYTCNDTCNKSMITLNTTYNKETASIELLKKKLIEQKLNSSNVMFPRSKSSIKENEMLKDQNSVKDKNDYSTIQKQ